MVEIFRMGYFARLVLLPQNDELSAEELFYPKSFKDKFIYVCEGVENCDERRKNGRRNSLVSEQKRN
jgi:hypothetical protein